MCVRERKRDYTFMRVFVRNDLSLRFFTCPQVSEYMFPCLAVFCELPTYTCILQVDSKQSSCPRQPGNIILA